MSEEKLMYLSLCNHCGEMFRDAESNCEKLFAHIKEKHPEALIPFSPKRQDPIDEFFAKYQAPFALGVYDKTAIFDATGEPVWNLPSIGDPELACRFLNQVHTDFIEKDL